MNVTNSTTSSSRTQENPSSKIEKTLFKIHLLGKILIVLGSLMALLTVLSPLIFKAAHLSQNGSIIYGLLLGFATSILLGKGIYKFRMTREKLQSDLNQALLRACHEIEMETVKALIEKGAEVLPECRATIVSTDKHNLLIQLLNHENFKAQSEALLNEALLNACKEKKPHLITRLVEKLTQLTPEHASWAITYESLELAKYLDSQRFDWSTIQYNPYALINCKNIHFVDFFCKLDHWKPLNERVLNKALLNIQSGQGCDLGALAILIRQSSREELNDLNGKPFTEWVLKQAWSTQVKGHELFFFKVILNKFVPKEKREAFIDQLKTPWGPNGKTGPWLLKRQLRDEGLQSPYIAELCVTAIEMPYEKTHKYKKLFRLDQNPFQEVL